MSQQLLDVVGISAKSVATVVCAASVGVYMRKTGILNDATAKGLEKAVKDVWTPAIIIANVVPTASPRALLAVLPMALMCFSVVVAGLSSGAACGAVLRRWYPDAFPRYTGLLMVAAAFPNAFSVPLTIHLALASAPVFAAGFPSVDDTQKHITSLFAFSYVIWVLARWSIGFPVISGACQDTRTILDKVLNAPVVACLVSIVIGSAVTLSGAAPGPWFEPVATAAEYTARCTVPVTLLLLGARLYDAVLEVFEWTAEKKPLEEQPLLGKVSLPPIAYPLVVVIRQGVGCAIGAGVGMALRDWAGLTDNVQLMVCMLQAAGPPMINLSVMAGVGGQFESEAAKIILCTYAASIVTWTASVALFLTLLN